MENEASVFAEVYLAKLFLIGNSRKYIQNLKTLRFFELAKVSRNKVSFAKINIFGNKRHAYFSIE